MNAAGPRLLYLLLTAAVITAHAGDSPLIVVQDLGGVSALPYYHALNLQDPRSNPPRDVSALSIPATPRTPYREADLLPVRSTRLSPGPVAPRTISVPGFAPLFLIGDDLRSRAWLQQRAATLRSLRAIGLVVHVDSQASLNSLRRLAPDLTLVPTSGDDLSQRLGIQHYPVLITATGIEQ